MPTHIHPPTESYMLLGAYGYPANVPNPVRTRPHRFYHLAAAHDTDTRDGYIARVAAAYARHRFYDDRRNAEWAAYGVPDPAALAPEAEDYAIAAAWWERVIAVRAEQAQAGAS